MPSPDKGPAEPSPNTFAILIFVIRDFFKYRVAEAGGTRKQRKVRVFSERKDHM